MRTCEAAGSPGRERRSQKIGKVLPCGSGVFAGPHTMPRLPHGTQEIVTQCHILRLYKGLVAVEPGRSECRCDSCTPAILSQQGVAHLTMAEV